MIIPSLVSANYDLLTTKRHCICLKSGMTC